MDSKTAYLAMYDFLDHYYQQTGADDVGGLLGSMSLLIDGSPADPAIAQEWQASVAKAEAGEVDVLLRIQR